MPSEAELSQARFIGALVELRKVESCAFELSEIEYSLGRVELKFP